MGAIVFRITSLVWPLHSCLGPPLFAARRWVAIKSERRHIARLPRELVSSAPAQRGARETAGEWADETRWRPRRRQDGAQSRNHRSRRDVLCSEDSG